MLHLLRPAVGDQVPVRILDMSQSGIGLRSSEPLPPGALVHIRIRGTIVAMGEVRYSARIENEYYSGVRVEHAGDCRSSWEID